MASHTTSHPPNPPTHRRSSRRGGISLALDGGQQALAQAGRHEQAEQTARSITDPDQQAQALTAVAEALLTAALREADAAMMG